MSIPIPKWLAILPPHQINTRRLRNRYLIKSAALCHTQDGQLELLARSVGCAYSTLVGAYAPDSPVLTPDMALRLEDVMSRDILPRELLLPDIFKF